MLPTKVNYPHFVPDQLLTSEHLNQVFEYLDEQGKLTRTNLIGIGIVCGMEVKTNATGTSLTITKGVGVTSEGYIVTFPGLTYTKYKTYDATKDETYHPYFVDSNDAQLFAIDELMQAGVTDGTTLLSSGYLNDKVVVMFVEVLKVGAKNCDPNSCDDKGVNVTVSFKPLLIPISKIATLKVGVGGVANNYITLPEVVIPRFDVTFTSIVESADIFEAYQKILNANFIKDIEDKLVSAYSVILPLVGDMYPSNPFAGLQDKFKFLHNDTATNTQLVNIQYYYDLFSDLIYGYEELRETGMELLAVCCPDNSFPRHLLLDLAKPDANKAKSDYRHYFIPSPIIGREGERVRKLRSLFRKLVLLIEKFEIPAVGTDATKKKTKVDDNIRITPSKHGDIPLSIKSIPYYYKVNDGTHKLYEYWNADLTIRGKANKNLSYHASLYNTNDAFVKTPLIYDLEPYNFLRIEGHIGKPYTHALQNILALKKKYRLPFEAIALSADLSVLRRELADLGKGTLKGVDPKTAACIFQDIETLFDTMVAELTCNLCKEMKYFYDLEGINRNANTGANANAQPAVPISTLLRKCDAAFKVKPGSFGEAFEAFYVTVKDDPYIASNTWLGYFGTFNMASTTAVNSFLIGFALLYYIEKLSETLVSNISSFDISAFLIRYNDLIVIAKVLKSVMAPTSGNDDTNPFEEDVLDHLDALIYSCKMAQFTALYKEYLLRRAYLLLLNKFGYFVTKHPGIQHKAGVPVGGTFILVYHEAAEEETPTNTASAVAVLVQGDTTATAAPQAPSPTAAPAATPQATASSSPQNVLKLFETFTGKKASDTTSKRKTTEALNVNIKAGDDVKTTVDDSGAKTSSIIDELRNSKGSSSLKININSSKNATSFEEMEELVRLQRQKVVNQLIVEALEDIEDGTVIADFYLPYLCYSDCPPLYYIVNVKETEPAPEKPTINIDPKDFCRDNTASIAITVTPEGGTVSGEGVSKDPTSGKDVFKPSTVNLGGQANKQVKITYTKDTQSADVTVTVHDKPNLDIEVIKVPGVPYNTLKFDGHMEFATEFEWDFGDGEKSTELSPTHTYQQDGTYKVTLTAKNGSCVNSMSDEVEIKQPVPVKQCFDPAELIKIFESLPGVDDKFKAWLDFYKSYADIEALFTALKKTNTVAEQIELFKKANVAVEILNWLKELMRSIGGNFALLGLAMLRILILLAMYIACIQDEDIDKAPVPMDNAFKLIAEMLEQIGQMLGQFTEKEKQILKSIQEDMEREHKRVIENGEKDIKKVYLAILERCIKIIISYKL